MDHPEVDPKVAALLTELAEDLESGILAQPSSDRHRGLSAAAERATRKYIARIRAILRAS